jgi:hypothetical protein
MASKIIVDQVQKSGGTAFTLPTSDGAANTFIKTDGSGTLSFASAAAGFNSVMVYTSSTDWVKSARPAGITKVIVEVQGGGGGGGYSGAQDYACSGSGGGYARKFIDVSSVTQAVISVGLAGTAAGTSSVAGGDGGDSSWVDTSYGGSSTVTGGKGLGIYANFGRAAGGVATGGDINIPGQPGDHGGGNGSQTPGGSYFGFPGRSGHTGQGATTASVGYGAGGPGGYSVASLAGMPGIVIVWEYK